MSGNVDFFSSNPINEEFNGDDKPEALKKAFDSAEAHSDQQEANLFKEPIEEEVKVEESNEEAKEASEEKIEEEIKEEIKRIQGIYGEENVEIPAEARFKQKVDGEEREVSFQELLNNYSGKESWDKKFTELDKQKKEYEQDLDFVNKYISEFANKSKEDPIKALEFLVQQVGLNPLEYRKKLRESFVQNYNSYLEMDDYQKQLFEKDEELQYLKQSRESELERQRQTQAQAEREQRFSQIQEAYGIDNDRRKSLEKELSEVYKAEVSPENLVELHTSLTRLDRVDQSLDKIDPSLKEDDDKVMTLESLLRGNPKMSDEQLSEAAEKLYGNDVSKAVKNLEKKVEPKNEQPKKQDYKPQRLSTNNIDFF